MGKGNKNLTTEQRSRLLEHVMDQVDELAAANQARMKELTELGIGVSPITQLAAMVQALVGWVAPTEYQRARFMLDVERAMENALSDENVGIAKEQMDAAAEERDRMAREMALAEQGRRESGLYVPESASTPAVVLGATGELAVVPEPPENAASGAIRPPAPPQR